MSDPSELGAMPEARLRDWFAALPHEELVEMFVSYVRVYVRERGGASSDYGPLGDLSTLTFAQLVDRLKGTLRLAELSRLRVDGERVVFVTDSGREVVINATGEQQAAPAGSPLAPRAPAREAPPDPQGAGGPSSPRRRGGLFGGAASAEHHVGGPKRREEGGEDKGPKKPKKSPLLEF